MTSIALPPRAAPLPFRRRALSSLARAAMALQLMLLVAFIAALAVGERTRLGFIAVYVPRQPLLAGVALSALVALVMRRRALAALQGAALLVVLVPIMGLRVAAAGESTRPIRLLSYNVFFGKMGRAAILDEIAASDADVILVQAGWSSMSDRLRERFPNRTVHRDGELVLLSRYPLRDVEVPANLDGGTSPMYVGYLLDTPEGLLRVYNVHPFSPRYALRNAERVDQNLAQREAQVAAVVAATRRPGPPFVIAGDTNLPGLSAIARRHLGGLKDAFEEVGTGFGYTFPAKLPWMRIDRALGGDGIRFVRVDVAPRGASDHRALRVELEL